MKGSKIKEYIFKFLFNLVDIGMSLLKIKFIIYII